MDYAEVTAFIQSQLADGLVLVIGSGLSAAEGIPGMGPLADHLRSASASLSGADAAVWAQIDALLAKGSGLEAALLEHEPHETLEAWIVEQTCVFLMPQERTVMSQAIAGTRELRLYRLLNKLLRPPTGLPILTTNYDRLIEVACELAGFHVDTTAVGQYAGAFAPERSCMGSCYGIKQVNKRPVLAHYPRALVLKPHGSFDWYDSPYGPRRCCHDLQLPRRVITPGLHKYKHGYRAPFDAHRELANRHIDKCARLLVIGYGFNDDHLQVHLEHRMAAGVPTLILNRDVSPNLLAVIENSPHCVCVSQHPSYSGVIIHTKDTVHEDVAAPSIWDLGVLVGELL